MKTYLPKENLDARKWRVIDADGVVLGRLAVRVADLLRGKDKATFTPHLDTGDFVIVINAEKVVFTGDKLNQKIYLDYSGYPGGQKQTSARSMLSKHPERILERAIKGMLPKNKLGRAMYRKLFVYAGDQHPHAAQKPANLNLN